MIIKEGKNITLAEKSKFINQLLKETKRKLRNVLILPPDFTRFCSGAGKLTEILYHSLPTYANVDIIPTLGQHTPMTEKEIKKMYGKIPLQLFKVHNWRKDTIKLGEIPGEYVKKISQGKANFAIDVEVNKMLVENNYDAIFSAGMVVPHEVLGMSNHNKNIFIGIAGRNMINKSHFFAALYGIENNLGRISPPLRLAFNYAEKKYLKSYPVIYVLIVMGTDEKGKLQTRGLYAGEDEETFIKAAKLSQKLNIHSLDKPLKKVVAYMDPYEFKSTWVANKAIYRTRMAIADEGELVIIAPGLKSFGENPQIDNLIRKYGYIGTPGVLKAVEKNEDLRENLVAAAHLIHGSSEGRFKITYAPGHLSKKEIEGVNFSYVNLGEIEKRYNPSSLKEGKNILASGEVIFYISNPAAGLWALKGQLTA
ncbi:MAG: D-mannonate epimerase [bacterium (Candidatus Ratteibacteria) CG_4_10_14_3_um_filter_41_18]|uniref:D-mannonate epimerase n=3 Tax=Candidatus Ratteibacteria TaxID=2979319 RepID=A0A2M7YHK4_9BACT|nr:MAG: D-mannonate epimerase [Candidatus Omnitrophica bacterium CG1_02_41_171]PIW33767.1 MAG: D-mannonate epimerase [bacterium (Candidatus Ratteibacteria) CG15_BIG_FIL_POST_REV_8_21_14_020_41_12]PIX77578.1 MAG: D-mannonate epimerase [bacterium (Candidatus Ratteibacteria) CG_4_10_14_3_um_filter_41_18]PJA62452.1 MAG: D-mannonate epimerase [bacterium (Candidatus Ratteibacteria) CG_4_9_14_3_um_filter_41_21]HCG77008.1 D-mannonate epimerase [bacterium]